MIIGMINIRSSREFSNSRGDASLQYRVMTLVILEEGKPLSMLGGGDMTGEAKQDEYLTGFATI